MKIIVEYLILISKESSFCNSIEAFNRLLQVDAAIDIKNRTLIYQGMLTCEYHITSNEITDKDQRYFQVRLGVVLQEDSDEIVEKYTEALKTIRTILGKAGGQIETLWDDISFLYSRKSYSMLYEIENLMRKLIANFMLITVGKEWVKETSPQEIQEVINKSKRKDYINILHTIDFIHLADFLIKPYSKRSVQDLYTRLRNVTKIEEIQELKEFIPMSNWQKYFSSLVNCEDSYLEKRWKDLYELRCKVAHNAIITRPEFDRIIELTDDLRLKLEEALLKLPQVSVPQDEREHVAENAAINISSHYADFIAAWRVIEGYLVEQASRRIRDAHSIPFSKLLSVLRNDSSLDFETFKKLQNLLFTRNQIVHNSAVEMSKEDITRGIQDMIRLIDEWEVFPDFEE